MESLNSIVECLPATHVLSGASALRVEKSASEMLVLNTHMSFLTIGKAPGGIERLRETLEGCLSSSLPYTDVREDVVFISLALNCLKRIAPRFRRLPSVPHSALNAEQVLLSQDKQFIDLHWLKCNGFKKTVDSKEFERLFLEADFAPLAQGFVQANWKSSTKIQALKLSETVQWELSSYQSDAHRDRWRVIENGDVRRGTVKACGAVQIRSRLEDSIASEPHFEKHVDGWVLTWVAGKVAEASGKTVFKVYELMVGSKPDRKSLLSKVATVSRRLGA